MSYTSALPFLFSDLWKALGWWIVPFVLVPFLILAYFYLKYRGGPL